MAKTSRIYLVFALELVLIVAVGVLAYMRTDQLITANRSAALTHEVLERLEVVLSLLKDAETGQRGFVLTGEERYLEPYDVAMVRIRQETDSLMALASDDSRNQSSLQRLQKLSDAKLAELEETIRLRRTSGLQATLPVILTDRGKKIMDEIRSVLAEIKARENLRMDERNRAATARANSVLRTIVLWTPLSLLILTATVVWLTGTARFEAATARRGPAGTRWIALFRYVLAVALPAGATVVQLRLNDLVGSLPYFILFYPTVLLVAILAGGGPAFVAIVVSALAVKYWFMAPIGSFQFEAPRDIATLMIFLGVNSFVCLIAVRMQRYQWVEAVRAAQEEELALLDLGNLLSLDPDHRIVHWSEGCRRLYGFGPEEVRGRLTHELLQTRVAQPLEQIHAALLDSGHWEGRATRRRKDGSEVVVAILWALRRDAQGRPTAILEVSTDITEQESAERAIRRQAALIEAANKELESFTYSVSHDLRAPLRAIDGFTQILMNEHAPALAYEPRRLLERVSDNSRKMGRLIDDLLRFSRLGRHAVTQAPVDTADLVRQCLDDLAAERAGRQVEIAVGELPPCWADPALLRQVWLNLLANALKFTRARDPARVEVGSSTQDGETVYFVRDNGVGFDMAYADKLFGVFQRLHRQEDYEGTGVGLALVQRILHRHGGRAWAEAEPGRGATFSFTLGRSDTDA